MAYNESAVSNTAIAFQKPITLQQGRALRDNPIAMFEGASGAPRLYGQAMHSPAAGTVVQRNCLPFGPEGAISQSATPDINKIYQSCFTAMVNCTVRVTLTFTRSSGSTTATFAIYKNGATIQSYTTNQTNTTVDVTLAAGDNIGVYLIAIGSSGGATGSISVTLLTYSFDSRSAVMT